MKPSMFSSQCLLSSPFPLPPNGSSPPPTGSEAAAPSEPSDRAALVQGMRHVLAALCVQRRDHRRRGGLREGWRDGALKTEHITKYMMEVEK